MRHTIGIARTAGAALLLFLSAIGEPGLAAQASPLRNGFWFGADGGYVRLDLPTASRASRPALPSVPCGSAGG